MMACYRSLLLCALSALLLLVLVQTKDVVNRSQRRVIVDVDPGIDDIEGLVFLINADNLGLLKLEAIIVTQGNTQYQNGVRNVYLLLEAANRKDIPVYIGAKRPILSHDEPMGGFYGEDGLGNLNWTTTVPPKFPRKTRGFEAIHKLVKMYPNQITYMSLAPMTTLGMTILLYSEIANDLKDVYAMGGISYLGEGEFNVKFDAEAVDIILRSLKTKMVLVTFEAGETNSPLTDWYKKESINNPVWNFMTKAQDAINKLLFGDDLSSAKWEHCDPIVPAVYLNPALIKTSFTHPMDIEVGRGPGRGMMTNSTRKDALPLDVILEIDYDLMIADFVKVFKSVCESNVECQEVN